MSNTKIEWTEATWNPIAAFVEDPNGTYTFPQDPEGVKRKRGWFCTHDSEGCRHCYSEAMNLWRGNGLEYIAQNLSKIRFEFVGLDQPIRWTRPRMIFPCSMTDLFADFYSDKMIDYVFAVMALSRRHVYQVLTKRARRMFKYMTHPEREAKWMNAVAEIVEGYPDLRKRFEREPVFSQREEWLPLPNVWLGVSVEDQKNADKRVPYLMKTPAVVRWVSAEPLLGPLDLFNVDGRIAQSLGDTLSWPYDRIAWVVAGGESGDTDRPMHPAWARKLRDDCAAVGVPFFFKQWGRYVPVPTGECSHPSSDGAQGPARDLARVDVWRCTLCGTLHGDDFDFAGVGKEKAGALLDGREHKEWPRVFAEGLGR
jgi:protein gp37